MEIVFIDNILVVNKPSGLLTISDGYDPSKPYLKKELESEFGNLWVVHRLDRQTAGLIIFARDAISHRNLSMQFERRQVEKKYRSIVIGNPEWQEMKFEAPLKVNADKKHRTLVDYERGKSAHTDFLVLSRFAPLCLIEAIPKTGYTHQIRSHLSFLGYPIFGDILYGFTSRKTQDQLPSVIQKGYKDYLMLFAQEIHFDHPVTHQTLLFSLPNPKYFHELESLLVACSDHY
jgi:tRNA pseudouridine32 synthase / 23S rRNA pseudouridine746 synthase